MSAKRILLISISTCEFIILAVLGYTMYSNWIQKRNILGDSVVTPLKKEYLIFPPTAFYSAYYEPKPNTTETNIFPWMSDSATYTINADGLNERFNYPSTKPPGAYRIIALGDSFTFGHYVNTADNWTELIEDHLNQQNPCPGITKYEVLNLGVRGYDIDFAAERYKIRGQKYNPDLVIWFINNHHFYMVRELVTQREDQLAKQMSETEKKRMLGEGNYFPALKEAIQETFQKYPMERLVEQENAGLYEFAKYYSGPLVLIANQIDSRYMVLLKIFQHFRSSPTYIFQNISDINQIAGAAFPDGHPSQVGHRLYAQDIYQYLTNQHLVCRK